MFTEPKIVLTQNPDTRGYITFYYDGKRYREYNGKKLDIELNPNQSRSYADRLRQFKKLSTEFYKSLLSGWSPLEIKEPVSEPVLSIKSALDNIRQDKMLSTLSESYKTDMNSILDKFFDFLTPTVLEQDVAALSTMDVIPFLNQFKSSSTYYMNRRRALNVYFHELQRLKLINANPIDESRKIKKVARLHKIYDPEKMKLILTYLSKNYPNLEICCLLAYGCFLRPHQEIRLLRKQHFNKDYSKITLSGSENKSRRIRTVNVPPYVQEVLVQRLTGLDDPKTNILSLTSQHYNLSYLNTQWSRAKKKMKKLGLIEEDQTIYSFRHSAAINVYKKTKDIHVLQQLLQHSNMIVTLTYLRGLGELDSDSLKDVLPEL